MSAPGYRPTNVDRHARLEARIAELERELAAGIRLERRRTAWWRVAVIGLVMSLVIPAGVVLASHQFSDVPDSNPFHADIDALVDSGVTLGCGSGKYCPKDYVTREQMAAFLNRLGALADDKTPVVNADRLDDYQANELSRVARLNLSGGGAIGTDLTPYGDPMSITVPSDGFVLVSGSASFLASACTGECWARVFIEHLTEETFSNEAYVTVNDFGPRASAATFAMFPVSAGVHEFRFVVSRASGTGTISVTDASAIAMFTPFDANGQTVTPPTGG